MEYEAEIGFTPVSRSRISMSTDTVRGDDPWADIVG